VLGFALALILDRVDRRMREPDEIQDLFDLPILGYIPESGALRKPSGAPRLRGREGEAFRMLRTSLLYFNVDKDIRSILVTSSTPGEGKTTVSWNLACAAAAGGANVLLVEADLRHPNLSRHVGVTADKGPGLSEILAGNLDPSEEVTRVPIAPGAKGPAGEPAELDVILSGPVPPNPTDLLESNRMRRLIQEAEKSYDLVVIDSPPTFVVPDAVPLVNQVSAVLVVTRVGLTTRDAARQLRDQLENLSAPTLGIVVNSVEQWRERYAYAYAYASQPSGNGFGGEKPPRRLLGKLRRSEAEPAEDQNGSPDPKDRTPSSGSGTSGPGR
jgi:capsular exopolysaccharide synthesis family protein